MISAEERPGVNLAHKRSYVNSVRQTWGCGDDHGIGLQMSQWTGAVNWIFSTLGFVPGSVLSFLVCLFISGWECVPCDTEPRNLF